MRDVAASPIAPLLHNYHNSWINMDACSKMDHIRRLNIRCNFH